MLFCGLYIFSMVESVSYCILSLQLTIPVDITYICVLLHVMSKILPTSGHIGHNVAIYLCAPDTKLLGEVHYIFFILVYYIVSSTVMLQYMTYVLSPMVTLCTYFCFVCSSLPSSLLQGHKG